jgi:uncharacterized repeat protein (TIGR02543 family)
MCDQIQSEGKSFGDHIWEISEEATCTTDGEEECTVDGCGQTRKIDATGHQFANNICEVCDQPEIYTITFDATTNGGILEGDAIIEKTNNGISFEDDEIELPTAFKEGAIFDGWYTEDGELIDAETVLSGTTADITVYAQFSQEVSE